jgi:hypothetical protein
MRSLIVGLGLILVVLGIVGLVIPTFTFVTTDRLADVGFIHIDLAKPHTVVINPIVGGLVLAGGIVLMLLGRRSARS